MSGYGIEVKHLTKQFEAFTLDDVSFAVPSGSIMGFIGENGAGKSTTIRLILGLLHPDGGEIRLLGEDAAALPARIREDIGVALDESFFHDSLRPKDLDLILKSIYRSWDSKVFYGYLDKFDLPDGQQVKKFSRGMKMNLSLSAALSHHARLLILDEATSGLDPVVRNEILDVFLEFVQDEGHSILVSSHITSDLERVCDYITFIHRGKIVVSESKDALLEQYGLIGCAKADFERIDRADIVGYRESHFGCEVLVHDRAAAARKYPGFQLEHVSLEDIMLFYVRGEQR